MGCFVDDLKAFRINADQWTIAAQDEGKYGGTRDGTFHGEMDTAEKGRAGLQHAVVYPNVTGMTKERKDQSKRTRARSLASLD